ncbi:MAG: ABC transporter substrate-binding protein [Lachnospiraceae bacterium]|nr:ABC transporter substrate-binding protein [Lachnospiraceae bacterium]
MKRNKVTSLVLAAVMVAISLTGCGGASAGESSETTTTEATAEVAAESTTEEAQEVTADAASGDVTIWYYWENESHQKALDEMIQGYNDSQGNVKVSAKYVPFADFKKQLSIGASAGELPDLVILDNPDHASYASMGIFADLTGKFDVSNYYDGPVGSCTYDSKLYGVPFGSNCLALYYNEDMMAAAGVEVPTTWDELKEAAVKLTTDKVSGLAFCSLQNEEGTFNFLPWVWSTGETSYTIDTEGGVKALSFVKDLVDSGAMSKECINWTQGDVMNQFISGNVAMMINGPWQVPTMRAEAPDLKWNVALIPQYSQYASGLGGENYGVIAGGNEAGALEFLKYATADEQVKFMMNTMGYISSDKTIAETQFTDDAVMKLFVEQMQYAQPRGPLAEWPDVSDAISLAFNQVITGAATPEEAATAAQQTIDGIVQ